MATEAESVNMEEEPSSALPELTFSAILAEDPSIPPRLELEAGSDLCATNTQMDLMDCDNTCPSATELEEMPLDLSGLGERSKNHSDLPPDIPTDLPGDMPLDLSQPSLMDRTKLEENVPLDLSLESKTIHISVTNRRGSGDHITPTRKEKCKENKSRRKRKQTHCPRAGGAAGDFEFVEISVPVVKSFETPTKKTRREKLEDYGTEQFFRDLNLSPGSLQEINRAVSMDDIVVPHHELIANDSTKHFFCSDEEPSLAIPAGIPPSERTPKKIAARKKSIVVKMHQYKGEPAFTKEEEFDIHERAEAYVSTVMPDPSYYFYPTSPDGDNKENKPCSYSDTNMMHSLSPMNRKRKRRSYSHFNCYVTHSRNERKQYLDMADNSYLLPEGTKLVKPSNKLVELVAQAIAESPDGLLQVQQVYHALMNKYPYFRFMEKTAINSWRSSIRHALYQKWFRKVRFRCELITSKGCYWAINRRHTPKEWTMPGSISKPSRAYSPVGIYYPEEFEPMSQDSGYCRGDYSPGSSDSMVSHTLTASALEDMAAVASITNLAEDALKADCLDQLPSQTPDPANPPEDKGHELTTVDQKSPQMKVFTYKTCLAIKKDPDPVLSGPSSRIKQEVPETPATERPTTPVMQTFVQQMCPWQHGAPMDSGYTQWVPSWEEYHQSMAYQPPLMPAAMGCYAYPPYHMYAQGPSDMQTAYYHPGQW